MWEFAIYPIDTCIDVLVLRGALLMQRFLQGEPSDSIAWLEVKETKKQLPQKKNLWLRRLAIVPLTIGGTIQ